MYIFPGVGLGVVACKSKHVTNDMFLIAAKTLAEQVTDSDLRQGSIYPSLHKIRAISIQIAMAVASIAFEKELASVSKPNDMKAFIMSKMWEPVYEDYV